MNGWYNSKYALKITRYNMSVGKRGIFTHGGASDDSFQNNKITLERHHVLKIGSNFVLI